MIFYFPGFYSQTLVNCLLPSILFMSNAKLLFLFLLVFTSLFSGYAQDAVSYQTPPPAISGLLLAKPTPLVSFDSRANWILLGERNSYPSVEELGQPELKIAGLRLNPTNFSPSRQNYIHQFRLKDIQNNTEHVIIGSPENLQATNIGWNQSETKIAFLNTGADRVDLYVIDIPSKKMIKWNKLPVNSTLGNAYFWLDDTTIVYKATLRPAREAPKKTITPKGPTVQESLGNTAPSPTFQDLIKSPYDESLFDFYASAQLVKNSNGNEKKIGKTAIYLTASPSPGKKFFLVKILHKPFSYLVTAFGFPSTVLITDANGKEIKKIAELPSTEIKPSGNDNTQNVPRDFSWKDDEAATVTWATPLDSGLINKPVEFHDGVYALSAPFTGQPKELFKTKMRYYGVWWGDSTVALVEEGLSSKQKISTSLYNSVSHSMETLYERNETDAYNDPGNPVTYKNKYGKGVIQTTDNGTKILMNNTAGSTPKGDLPFLAKFDIASKKNEIVWRCGEGKYESVVRVLDPEKLVLLTRSESPKDPPNFFIRRPAMGNSDTQITDFPNPYPQLEGVTKQKIFYKRADSVDLTGDLYLPTGYNKEKDGPLPVFIWAYPREFNSASDAAQVRGSQYHFAAINWASPIFFVTQGYAVLDNAEMPIVAKGDNKPNDNFVEQLRMNAEAAINKLVELGVGDRKRIAVGGHSYGAFMTANLLAHTDLFRAGIARSGAYNRTLTPFGFQNEDRTYWEVPQLYYAMSPFSYADKIKTPLLLIHGEADDNTGTFPINSERLFNAIKGNGGTVRLVFLPYEAHGYRGRENLLHMLWEENQWLEKYVKNAK
jgi:dipeptidyl aminopeptidase/acylaminoacyl peptidase